MQSEELRIPVSMVRPLPGFPDTHDYLLRSVPGNPLFFWLESEDGPRFVITKPGVFFHDYKVEIKEKAVADLQSRSNIEVYAIVTVPEDPLQMTANLMAPLLVNVEKGLGYQLVLYDSPYTTRHYLFPPEKRRNCG